MRKQDEALELLCTLSPDKHNSLRAAVIEEFAPRFAPGAKLLYLADAGKKPVVCSVDKLAKLKIGITEHDKLPDIVLYGPAKNWLFLIDAATTHGPVSERRRAEIETMLRDCPAGRNYITAFRGKADFRRHLLDIAWETEVWIAATPDHMIHFNGPKFLGPYKRGQS